MYFHTYTNTQFYTYTNIYIVSVYKQSDDSPTCIWSRIQTPVYHVYVYFCTHTNFRTHDYVYFFTSTDFPNHTLYVYSIQYTNYVFLRMYILKHVYKQYTSHIRVFTHFYMFFSHTAHLQTQYFTYTCLISRIQTLHLTYTFIIAHIQTSHSTSTNFLNDVYVYWLLRI